jgi:hypothetical protein
MSLLTDASLLVTPNAYKATKLYSIIPSNGNGDFTVTRATTATRINSAGLLETVGNNIPRLDYSLGSCPNILLEPQRTNIALYSEDFADATWSKLRTTVTQNTTNSPDNTLSADTIEVSSSGQAYFLQAVTTVAGTVNVSIYCKYINQQFLQIYSSSSGQAYANFDILNGLAGSNGTNASNVQITTAANGFYRISVALVVPVASINIRFAFVASSSSAYNPSEGIAGRQFYAWGAQFESGGYSTSYISTTSASVTRNLDQILRSNVYTNGLITASGGTWFVDIRGNVPVVRDLSTSGIFLNAGVASTIGNGFVLRNAGSTLTRMGVFTVVAGGLSANLHTIATDNAKVAFKWNGTTADVFVNGVKVVAATPFTPTAMENLVGEGQNRAVQINSMALFPTPLTDPQCIALTT